MKGVAKYFKVGMLIGKEISKLSVFVFSLVQHNKLNHESLRGQMYLAAHSINVKLSGETP